MCIRDRSSDNCYCRKNQFFSPKKVVSITTIPLIESFTLLKKTYLIAGSPKCPLTGLTGGELVLGINPLSSEKQSFSIAQ